MVKLIVNGNLQEFDASAYKNFGELLDAVSKEQSGKVLKELSINGKMIPISRVDELRGAVIDENIEIEMNFASLQEFFVSTLSDVVDYIDNILSLLDEVSKEVMLGNREGFDNINNLAEGISAMENLRTNAIKLTGLTPADFENNIEEVEVMNILSEFVKALETKDLIELSDLLQNKIPIVLKYYRGYFKNVLNSIEMNN
ncbi:hypothetical protein JYK00_02340 [Thermosipho ferrireducens]|uniref:Uncharacterized protein n=1 Tax=Thermosipho ferrireducens TaxID=2571116 RepID=A0ABX7S850_9BACT|nr:hypothetical protein [Thermosipho ferrireducens]QTA38384.1 hypothetical protein JYK00_02340 [Thermosipho ferrireducens]